MIFITRMGYRVLLSIWYIQVCITSNLNRLFTGMYGTVQIYSSFFKVISRQGSIFWSKTDIYSPPPRKSIFSPLKQRDFRATLPTT
jgi:hypothetical protein